VAAVVSVGVAVAAVVVITTLQETANRAIVDVVVHEWFGGSAHLAIHPPGAHWGSLERSLAEDVAELPGVAAVTARLQRAVYATPVQADAAAPGPRVEELDALGIDPRTEGSFLHLPQLQGRMLQPDERGVVILERATAASWNLGLGDTIRMYLAPGSRDLTIIGLIENVRIAMFQRPIAYVAIADLEELRQQAGGASVIYVLARDATSQGIQTVEAQLNQLLHERQLPYRVESSAAQQELLEEAQRLTRLGLMLVAFLVLLTAFFIILTTMSASLAERNRQLGMLRCLGLTRGQLTTLVLVELLPLGVAGTIVGVALGIGGVALMGRLLRFTQDFVPQVVLSEWGLGLAVVSGLATTLVAALILVAQVARLSPLAAVLREARPARVAYLVVAAVVGVAAIAAQEWMSRPVRANAWLQPAYAFTGLMAGYVGYALIVPALVMLIGRPVARLVAPVLRLPPKLASDPSYAGQSPWRAAGVCWMLLVGVSLIAYVAVRVESVMTIWNFPAALPQTFVWAEDYVPAENIDAVRRLPGVTQCTALVDVGCELERVGGGPARGSTIVDRLLRKFTRPVFVAGEADELLAIMKVDLAEGNWTDARVKLERGGYVLIPTQTATQHDLHLGDRVEVRIGKREAEFQIAGVAHSAAFDLAVDFFQAGSYMELAGASAVLGTRADLREKFGLDVASLFLCNVDVPPTPRPADFERSRLPNPFDAPAVAAAVLRWGDAVPHEAGALAACRAELQAWVAAPDEAVLSAAARELLQRWVNALDYIRKRWTRFSADEDWYAFKERLVLCRIAATIDRPAAVLGSLERLTQWFQRTVRTAANIATWIPSIALFVAILGIANLMLVSVRARARALAILHAVGALRSQVLRLVLLEAITLGLIGGAVGLTFGIRLAVNVDAVVGRLTGYGARLVVPYATLGQAVLLTVIVCMVAALPPARLAARTNVIDALHTT